MINGEIKKKALDYETQYSRAYGGEIHDHGDFIHIKNRFVKFAGDFNRAIILKLHDTDHFEKIINKVDQIHNAEELDTANSFYVHPPRLDMDIWGEYLKSNGYSFKETFGFIKEVKPMENPKEYFFVSPTDQEYFRWYYDVQKTTDYFNQEWYDAMLPSMNAFISQFKPYWLIKDDEILGWSYCNFNDEICNVHDVWIEEKHRGKGLSRILFDFINNEADKNNCCYLNLYTFEDRNAFYQKLGFELYSTLSIIRRV